MLNPDQEKRFAEALILDAAEALANLDDRGVRNACARIREVNSFAEPLPAWLSRDLCRDFAVVMDRMADAIGNAKPVTTLKLVGCPETPDLSDAAIATAAFRAALMDTIDGAVDDASDQLAAEALGMPIETFRAALARASESTADADAEERAEHAERAAMVDQAVS